MDRLQRELLKDVSLHVTEQGTDAFNVAGRGEMHISILIETMRREGYEFQVSTPRVLTKVIDGKVCEPIERMVADVPEASMGSVIEKMGRRKGDLLSMNPVGSRYRLEFLVPSRGLFGYRSEFLTDTRGEGIMSSVLDSYAPVKGEIERRKTGSLVAFESGEACTYGLFNAQERGVLFIGPGTQVYAGMVVGICSRNEDMTVNVCKKKQLTNMRAAGADDALRLTSPRQMSLEQCLEIAVEFALQNRTAVLHLYNSASHEAYEHSLMDICHSVVGSYFDTAFAGKALPEADREVLVRFYQCECYGQIVLWMSQGMQADIVEQFRLLCHLRQGMMEEMIDRCCDKV